MHGLNPAMTNRGAPQPGEGRRLANDGSTYTHEQFMQFYGASGEARWRAAQPAPPTAILTIAQGQPPPPPRVQLQLALPAPAAPPVGPGASQQLALPAPPVGPGASQQIALPAPPVGPVASHQLALPAPPVGPGASQQLALPAPPGASQPRVIQWRESLFYQVTLWQHLEHLDNATQHRRCDETARDAINLAYELYRFLPLPEQAFRQSGLKDLLNMPDAVFIAAERVHNIPDYNRPPDTDRVDFFCYMADGHVCRKHPGRGTGQDAQDHWMSPDAGVFNCNVAQRFGAGHAMHRCPPALAISTGGSLRVGTVLLNEQHLRAYSAFDHQHWPWTKFQKRSMSVLRDPAVLDHSDGILDITEGNEMPWWLCFVHTFDLHDIVKDGILSVKAKWHNTKKLVLFVQTTRGHVSVWRDSNKKEFITEQLEA